MNAQPDNFTDVLKAIAQMPALVRVSKNRKRLEKNCPSSPSSPSEKVQAFEQPKERLQNENRNQGAVV